MNNSRISTEQIKTLVILAAGRGTRFGGPKQFTCFGPHQKTLMEYNIIHAINAGIEKIIFVVQPKHDSALKEVITRLPKSLITKIAFQTNENLPAHCTISAVRNKPLGTAHALWCAKTHIKEAFVVINADDYYGKDAFDRVKSAGIGQSAIVAYPLEKTLSDNGGVNRGLCTVDDNKLTNVEEVTNIVTCSDTKCMGTNSEGQSIEVNKAQLVSMNFWLLTPAIFAVIEVLLVSICAVKNEGDKEVYLPQAVFELLASSQVKIKVLTSHNRWFGVTYAADSVHVETELAKLSNEGKFDHRIIE